MLKLDCLEIGFPDRAWSKQISLTVRAGEICVLHGPSGCGKSTLLSTIAGFQPALSGILSWQDKNLLDLAPWDRPLTLLFQSGNLFEGLTLYQNVALGIRTSGQLSKSERQTIKALLERFELQDLSERLPQALSGGQQQRAGLARAILRQQPILLLDEPFTGLDEDRRKTAIQLISNISKEQNCAILLVSHDMRDAEALGAHSYSL